MFGRVGMGTKLLTICALAAFAPPAHAAHFRRLYAFNGGSDGGAPYGGHIADAQGNLTGTTQTGGAQNAGDVFKVRE